MPQGGRYLRCDVCGDPANDFSLNLPWSRDGETLRAARDTGWKIGKREVLEFNREFDVCPKCKDVRPNA